MLLKTSKRVVWIGFAWCLASVLIGIGVGKVTKDFGYQALHAEAADRLLASIHRVRGALNAYHYLPFLLTQNEDVVALTQQSEGGATATLAQKVSRYLEQTNLVAGASGLFIVNHAGRTVAYSNWRDQQYTQPNEFAQLPIFELTKRGEEGRFYDNQLGEQAYYYLSAPIYNHSRFVGAAIVRIELERLLPDSPPDELFAISDDKQRIFIASPRRWIGQERGRIAQQSEVSLPNGAQVQMWTIEHQHYLTHKVRLDDLGWTFTTLISAKASERYADLLAVLSTAGLWILGILLLYLRERRLKHLSQQETRAALARNEEQQRSIISNAEVGLLTLNQLGQIRFINPKAAQQFNQAPEHLIGQTLSELLLDVPIGSTLAAALNSIGKDQFSGVAGVEAVALRAPDTQFPALISLREMQHNPQFEYLATIVDISRRKHLEQALLDMNESLEHKVQERTLALQNAQQELIQTSKMAALGRMSTAIVHELNQPLTAMRTYIAISRQLLSEPELLAENLTLLEDLTQRMAVITAQLKTFAYKKPAAVTPVSIQTALAQTLLLLRKRLEEEHIQLETEIGENHWVMGDNARLEQVLVNLLTNACDALQGRDSKQIQIASQPVGSDAICLTIFDNGSGIEETSREHLFEPFYTTKPMGSGLGLGLAIVAAIVRDLHGTIQTIDSPLGGAGFAITLPAANLNSDIVIEE